MNRPGAAFFLGLFLASVLAVAAKPDISTRTGWFPTSNAPARASPRDASVLPGKRARAGASPTASPWCSSTQEEKTVLRVDNPEIVRGREGDHVRIEAVPKNAKTLHVTSVKILEKHAAKCSVD